MNKELAIRTIEAVFNQIDEETQEEFDNYLKKHGVKYPANNLKRYGQAKLVALAKELGPLFSAESYVYDRQAEYINEEFGKEAMDLANYGWGVEGDLISTKIYGYGVLNTSFNQDATNPDEVNEDHDFEYFHSEEEE